MNIAILTAGTRGDVQPYIALGAGLNRAGHHVTLISDRQFAPLASRYGLNTAPLDADFLDIAQSAEGKAVLSGSKTNVLKLIKMVKPMMRRMLDSAWEAAQGADAIVYHPKALAGYSLAEALHVPGYFTHPVPLVSPTAAFPNPGVPFPNLGGAFNRWSYGLLWRVAGASTQGVVNEWRKSVLGLAPARDELRRNGKPIPKLYGYSETVLPRPADWDSTTIVTGYWFLDADPGWQPSRELERFLAAGEKPVYIGFGSMAAADAERKTAAVIAALKATGRRGVLATGNGALALAADDQVFVLDQAPHDWLFPRMAAVVHHGGAGTTGAAFRAGVPQVIYPFFADQPFWGKRVAALGVGVGPVSQKKLNAANLADAIARVTSDTAMQTRACTLGEAIRAEDGVTRAVEIIGGRG